MKKQILALMACAAFWAPTSGFCMENDDTFQTPGMKKVNLEVLYKPTYSSPYVIKEAYLSYKCGENQGCLGHYQLTSGYLEKREVFLPQEGDTVRFSFFCRVEKGLNGITVPGEEEFSGPFYEGSGYPQETITDIQQSSILDGSRLELSMQAYPIIRKYIPFKGLGPAYDLAGIVSIKK